MMEYEYCQSTWYAHILIQISQTCTYTHWLASYRLHIAASYIYILLSVSPRDLFSLSHFCFMVITYKVMWQKVTPTNKGHVTKATPPNTDSNTIKYQPPILPCVSILISWLVENAQLNFLQSLQMLQINNCTHFENSKHLCWLSTHA